MSEKNFQKLFNYFARRRKNLQAREREREIRYKNIEEKMYNDKLVKDWQGNI